MLTLRHIEIFTMVCQEKSVTRAAERLHISQPTVSAALKEIEEHYKQPLFDRQSHKLFINSFGLTIYDYALRLLNLHADMIDAKASFDRIRIGTGTAIGKLFMPSVVKSFSELHPNAKVTVSVGDASRMYSLAMENAVDFVIAETVDDIPGLAHRAIQSYPVVGICHRNNHLTEKKTVTAEDLINENLLLREKGSSTRSIVDNYFQNHNLNVSPVWESYSVQTLLNATREGIGICFLSLDHVLAYASPDLIILNIPDLQAERFVNVSFHKDKLFSPLMKEFLIHYIRSTKQTFESGIRQYNLRNPDASYRFQPYNASDFESDSLFR